MVTGAALLVIFAFTARSSTASPVASEIERELPSLGSQVTEVCRSGDRFSEGRLAIGSTVLERLDSRRVALASEIGRAQQSAGNPRPAYEARLSAARSELHAQQEDYTALAAQTRYRPRGKAGRAPAAAAPYRIEAQRVRLRKAREEVEYLTDHESELLRRNGEASTRQVAELARLGDELEALMAQVRGCIARMEANRSTGTEPAGATLAADLLGGFDVIKNGNTAAGGPKRTSPSGTETGASSGAK